MTRFLGSLLVLILLSAGVYGAHAIGLGEGNRFGRLGSFKKNSGSSPPAGCGTGVIDASAGCPLPMLGS